MLLLRLVSASQYCNNVYQDNVLMTSNGIAQLIDFGLAQIVGARGFTTTLRRNARYTAPELMPVVPQEDDNQSNVVRPTFASDVFSFSMFLLQVGFFSYVLELLTYFLSRYLADPGLLVHRWALCPTIIFLSSATMCTSRVMFIGEIDPGVIYTIQ